MADETTGPMDATTPLPGPRNVERAPGRAVDMTAFEESFAGAAAAGPVMEWAILWRDGRVLVVQGEDEALFIARSNPTCRVVRRFVSPWLHRDPGAD
jgi:hypothetical protein